MDVVAPIMTKYEYTRVRGIRLQQLTDGMKAFVNHDKDATFIEIFQKELREKKIPLKVTRPVGFEKYLDIPVSELNVDKFIEN
jgi:DNA-directed RNA polymerase subunit K/omega